MLNETRVQFRDVYEEHVWRVYGFLAYRVRDRYLAEDLTQATFEHALRAWSRFDPGRASVASWLMAIGRNLLIDHLRRNRAEVAELDDSVLPTTTGPEARFVGSDELLAAISQLAEREQEVLALRFGGDLDAPTIASILNTSPANIHQIQSRSLRKLRAALTAPGTARLAAKRHG
jgi:RNA polymerase sigma-70 factor (ECF subfamily)